MPPLASAPDGVPTGWAVDACSTTRNGALTVRPPEPATTIVCWPAVASCGMRTVTENDPLASALRVPGSTGVLSKVAVSGARGPKPLPERTTA